MGTRDSVTVLFFLKSEIISTVLLNCLSDRNRTYMPFLYQGNRFFSRTLSFPVWPRNTVGLTEQCLNWGKGEKEKQKEGE